MGKLIYLMGKSSSGKDTIFKKLLEEKELAFQTIVMYTTRPIRDGERDGVEYFFTDEKGVETYQKEGKIIELRAYNTFHGVWKYFTVDDGQFDFAKGNFIMIGTLESYQKTKAYFGEDKMIPIMIDLDDGVRLERALRRERQQEQPKYQEMCRRFLADEEDFSMEKQQEAGAIQHFYNGELEQCMQEIIAYIKKKTQ